MPDRRAPDGRLISNHPDSGKPSGSTSQRYSFAYSLIAFALIAVGLVAVVLIFQKIFPVGPIPEPSGRVVESSALDAASIALPGSGCFLQNNIWNRAAADPAFHQEIFLEQIGGSSGLGWRWRSPWLGLSSKVIANPRLVCGNRPWDPPQNAISDFPFLVGTRGLTANFAGQVRSSSAFQLLITLWIVSSLPASPEKVTHEISIWKENDLELPPKKFRRGRLNTEGELFDVFVEQHHKNANISRTQSWTYVAFLTGNASSDTESPACYRACALGTRLDLSAFMDWLLQQNILQGTSYVTSFELGSEILQGAGIAEVQRFSLEFSEQIPAHKFLFYDERASESDRKPSKAIDNPSKLVQAD